MKQAQHSTTKPGSSNDQFALGTVALDLLDTTWRIAVPVVACAAVGIVADRKLGTKPWLTLALTVVGFVLAGLLIKRQLRAVAEKEDSKP